MNLRQIRRGSARGYQLTEALVYIGAVVVLLGVGYLAMHRCIDQSLVLRRNAQDITHAVHIGELWRQDVRTAKSVSLENAENEQLLHLEGSASSVDYLFTQGVVYRRVGSGPWSCILERVLRSSMRSETREPAFAWHWDFEICPEIRGVVRQGKVRPLFSFIAAATRAYQP